MIHELKCAPDYFARLADGSKTFEIRKDDRGYQAGDELVLRPFSGKDHDCADEGCLYNWRRRDRPVVRFQVGFVAKGKLFGLDLGEHAVLSLLPVPVEYLKEDRDG